MTSNLVVPTLTALTAENQPLEQFWAASCERWVKIALSQFCFEAAHRVSFDVGNVGSSSNRPMPLYAIMTEQLGAPARPWPI
jgi:hypothetical protein